ncbi:MAG: glutathione S-transferase N-terminal domain-containing protein [Chromatiales bacterium]|jgi:glutathione S-transferase
MIIKLVSFKLCPFVQRAVITLEEKGVVYDLEYIELDDPPAWFKARSPFGKVPLLLIGEEVLFESAVILDYLDEVYPRWWRPGPSSCWPGRACSVQWWGILSPDICSSCRARDPG